MTKITPYPYTPLTDDLTPEAVERLARRIHPIHNATRLVELQPHTAKEIAKTLRALSARVAELEAERAAHHANPADFRYWEGRYRDEQSRAEAAEAALATARADALREAAEICDDLAIGYAKHVGVPTALLDAKRDILALIPKEQPNE
jgi:hypothetical protein